jgi:hypothetical protein
VAPYLYSQIRLLTWKGINFLFHTHSFNFIVLASRSPVTRRKSASAGIFIDRYRIQGRDERNILYNNLLIAFNGNDLV